MRGFETLGTGAQVLSKGYVPSSRTSTTAKLSPAVGPLAKMISDNLAAERRWRLAMLAIVRIARTISGLPQFTSCGCDLVAARSRGKPRLGCQSAICSTYSTGFTGGKHRNLM